MRMSIDTWAERCVDRLQLGAAAHFAVSPARTLRDDLGLKVRPVENLDKSRDDGGLCDGVSFLGDGVILYRATGNRRENFTLAHELGHYLVDETPGVYDWLWEQAEPGKMLETVCDRIAQELLLPDALVVEIVVRGPIRARHVGELFGATKASHPACGIALARRLPKLGAVIIIDKSSSSVEYASVRPDPDEGWPTVFPWPGQAVPPEHPLRRLQPGAEMTRRSFWQTPWRTRQDYYIDAVADVRRVTAVLSDTDVWESETLHIDSPREYDQRPVGEIRCCGQTRTVRGYPCQVCGEPFCPECQRCRCDRRREKEGTCSGCYLNFQQHLLVDGKCDECRN
jgi:hypothetical protein